MRSSDRKFNSWSFGNSMSLRFIEGEPDDEAKAQAAKEAEEAELKRQEEFNKVRQLADMEAANAAKARQQVTQVQEQLAQGQKESAAMKAEIEALRAKAGDQGIDLNEEDFSDSDVTLVKAIKSLEAKFEAKHTASIKKIAELEKLKDNLIAEREAENVKRSRDATYNELLSGLDEEYGAQHRNAAVKAFDKLAAEGKVPNNAALATRAMERCYKDAAKVAKDNPKKVPLDPGSGGGSPNLGRKVKLKPGSLAEVTAQLEAMNV